MWNVLKMTHLGIGCSVSYLARGVMVTRIKPNLPAISISAWCALCTVLGYTFQHG
jgi:hypothetical protein